MHTHGGLLLALSLPAFSLPSDRYSEVPEGTDLFRVRHLDDPAI